MVLGFGLGRSLYGLSGLGVVEAAAECPSEASALAVQSDLLRGMKGAVHKLTLT